MGRPARQSGNPVNPPVVLSSTYVGQEQPGPGDMVYARDETETWHPFEEAMGALEGGGLPGLVFASGQAAISAVLDTVQPGGVIVAPRHAYHEALVAIRHTAARSGGLVRTVDITDDADLVRAIEGAGGPPANLVWIETPTNPMLEVADLRRVAELAHRVGAILAVDNTFATPLLQRPLELGADVVVHSATKYLAGHSDVVLGAAVTSHQELYTAIHQRRTTGGGVAGPWETWLALRGLRTLALRLERAQANAHQLSVRLQEHPGVANVTYPGLPTHPQHDLATAQMDGYGAILTLRLRGGVAAARRFTESVKLWLPATSLGGVESTLERRRRWPNEAPSVPEDLLRVSVGIEHVEDLWADLNQALRASAEV